MSGDKLSSVCATGMSQMNHLQKSTIEKMYRVEKTCSNLAFIFISQMKKTFMESLLKSLNKIGDILQDFLAYYEIKRQCSLCECCPQRRRKGTPIYLLIIIIRINFESGISFLCAFYFCIFFSCRNTLRFFINFNMCQMEEENAQDNTDKMDNC